MSKPRFSVIIPTRDREETLAHALRTCTEQSFDDAEIIVCDNSSSNATRDVVAACDSGRVRYVRAPRPLAMSENWELGLSEAKGEYIAVIGDDDGLLPGALAKAELLLREYQIKAMRWDRVQYHWPTIGVPEVANQLILPLSKHECVISSTKARRLAISYRIGYEHLPMLYNALVHRDVLAEIHQRAGRYLPCSIPDIFSGLAITRMITRYLSIGTPLSMNGGSGKSNGVTTAVLHERGPTASTFRDFNARAGLSFDLKVPEVYVVPCCIAEAAMKCDVALKENVSSRHLNRRRLIIKCLAACYCGDETNARQILAAVEATLADDPATLAWFRKHYAPFPDRLVRRQDFSWKEGVRGHHWFVDAARHHVTNVYEAAQLSRQLLENPPAAEARRLTHVKELIRMLLYGPVLSR